MGISAIWVVTSQADWRRGKVIVDRENRSDEVVALVAPMPAANRSRGNAMPAFH